jgi:hypothetical protein
MLSVFPGFFLLGKFPGGIAGKNGLSIPSLDMLPQKRSEINGFCNKFNEQHQQYQQPIRQP